MNLIHWPRRINMGSNTIFILLLLEVLLIECQQNGTDVIRFLIDGAVPAKKDDYWCTYQEIHEEKYVTFLKVVSEVNRAHHIILMSCSGIAGDKTGPCDRAAFCIGSKIMFAWAHNAPPKTLPADVGFRIGSVDTRYLMIQIHYANVLPPGVKDNSGLELHTTIHKPKYIAGVYLMVAGGPSIPPHDPNFNIDIVCKAQLDSPIHLFSYRTHAHGLSRVITGYFYNETTHNFLPIVKGNPQWPQAFYPFHKDLTINNGDVVVARCNYDSTTRNTVTHIGSTSNDEMCNLYLMYYTDADEGEPYYACGGNFHLPLPIPPDSTEGLPNNTHLDAISAGSLVLEPGQSIDVPNVDSAGFLERRNGQEYDEMAEPYPRGSWKNDGVAGYFAVANWPSNSYSFGQITAVAEDLDGNVVLFHRGPRSWDSSTFNFNNEVTDKNKGPINVNTVITLDRNTGQILHEWGKDLFFLPHGMTIDRFGWIYITDVGYHQVFRYHPRGQFNRPDLTLGTRFVPGNTLNTFCKPTSVAVTHEGDFYVADGYCNSRILLFGPTGTYKSKFEVKKNNVFSLSKPPAGSFNIPHKIIYLPDRKHICVADRQNHRIQCFDDQQLTFSVDGFEGGLYSISYTPARGGLLFAVTSESSPQGFIYQYDTKELLSTFSPNGRFNSPHDIHVSFNGSDVFVVEIGPNRIWRFIPDFVKTNISASTAPSVAKEIDSIPISTIFPPTNAVPATGESAPRNVWKTAGIISSILALPILMCIGLVMYVRRKRRLDGAGHSAYGTKTKTESRHGSRNWKKFRLDNLLDPKHQGFEILKTEEDDYESSSSESEVNFQVQPSKA